VFGNGLNVAPRQLSDRLSRSQKHGLCFSDDLVHDVTMQLTARASLCSVNQGARINVTFCPNRRDDVGRDAGD
jgi:hypothetical protein